MAIDRGSVSVLLPTSGVPFRELVSISKVVGENGLKGIAAGDVNGWHPGAMLGRLSAYVGGGMLASSVISLASSSVPQIAMTAVTLAEASGGRFTLGIGLGSPVTAGWHERNSPLRIQDLRKALVRIGALISDGTDSVGDEGARFRIGCRTEYRIPVYVGSVGSHGRDLACEMADGLITLMTGPTRMAKLVESVERKAREARRIRPRIVAIQWVVPPSAADSMEVLAFESVGYLMTPGYGRRLDQELRSRVASVYRRSGRRSASRLVPLSLVDEIGTAGTLLRVVERIEELVAAGADEVRLLPLGGGELGWFAEMCRCLGGV